MANEIMHKLEAAMKFYEREDFIKAIEVYKNILQLEPDNYNAWFNLARCLQDSGQINNSIMAYQQAISIRPKAPDSYRNLGNIYYLDKNDPLTTVSCYKNLLELEPENNDAKICIAVAYLKTKNYKEGWKYFESRLKDNLGLKLRELYSKNLQKPIWQGEDISDKIIYVYYEGGLGDTIMFSRFLSLLKDKCKKVLFRSQVNSIELFKENFTNIEILDIKTTDDMLDFDVHIPIMSLPYRLGINNEKDIPFTNGYLKANTDKIKDYREKYFKSDKFKIGIKWQGNTNSETTRMLSLKYFEKLLDLKDVIFYSLQKGEGQEQLKNKTFEIVDLGSTFDDFSDTAAAIENLDLVISNDTSVGHLAGALGKKCWILLPFVQDWRWSTDISYCTWYKSIKLFKQNEPGNWDELTDRVLIELKRLLPTQ